MPDNLPQELELELEQLIQKYLHIEAAASARLEYYLPPLPAEESELLLRGAMRHGCSPSIFLEALIELMTDQRLVSQLSPSIEAASSEFAVLVAVAAHAMKAIREGRARPFPGIKDSNRVGSDT